MLGFIIDAILVLIVVIGLIVGIKRGFIKTIAKPVKVILTLVIAFSLASPLSEAIIEPMVKEPVSNQIEEYIIENCEGITPENINEELPTVLKIGAGIFNIDIENLVEGESAETIIEKIVSSLISPAIHVISTVITFVLLYFISGLILSLLLWILNAVFDVGVVGAFNRVLGAIFSTAFAIIIAWALASLFTYVINLPAVQQNEWAREFNGGFIYRLFNNLNPIELLLSF